MPSRSTLNSAFLRSLLHFGYSNLDMQAKRGQRPEISAHGPEDIGNTSWEKEGSGCQHGCNEVVDL